MATLSDSISSQLAHINDNRQATIVGLKVLLTALSTIAVALRLLSRRLVKAPFRYDDYAVVVALVRPPSLTKGLADP